MKVVAVGNPFDGLSLWGPFEENGALDRFCEGCNDDTWWIMDVHPDPDSDLAQATERLFDHLYQLDGPFLRKQREWLLRQDCAEARGLTEFLDKIADYAHDHLDIDCLLDVEPE